jgi:GNAT superfamily N-acetyltransferase
MDSSNLVVTGLNGLGSRYAIQLAGNLRSLDPQRDNEEPISFTAWLREQNSSTVYAPFGTRCLVDVSSQTLLAVGTLCREDRDAQEFLTSQGSEVRGFIGGVQVWRQFRGAGIGSWFVRYLDREISAVGGGRWALFTGDPIAATIYTRLGYQNTGLLLGRETVYVKNYA